MNERRMIKQYYIHMLIMIALNLTGFLFLMIYQTQLLHYGWLFPMTIFELVLNGMSFIYLKDAKTSIVILHTTVMAKEATRRKREVEMINRRFHKSNEEDMKEQTTKED